MDLRAWLAGCALANPNVVNDQDPVGAAKTALAAADATLRALRAPVVLDAETISVPNEVELADWEAKIRQDNATNAKITKPAIPIKRHATLPMPTTADDQSAARTAFSAATQELRRASSPAVQAVKSPGYYSVKSEDQ